jgi:hypothetical protein
LAVIAGLSRRAACILLNQCGNMALCEELGAVPAELHAVILSSKAGTIRRKIPQSQAGPKNS